MVYALKMVIDINFLACLMAAMQEVTSTGKVIATCKRNISYT